jgi:hypothetical protein
MSSLNGHAPWGHPDPIALNRLQAAVENLSTSLPRDLIRGFQNIDPRRNLDDECGYPPSSTLNAQLYRDLYDREPLATRTVQLLPEEAWQVQPNVTEDDSAENVTPFEEAWDALSRQLAGPAGNGSWYQDEDGSSIWQHLKRADTLSGIGHYGILLFGIDDGKELWEPVDGVVEFVANGWLDSPITPAEEICLLTPTPQKTWNGKRREVVVNGKVQWEFEFYDHQPPTMNDEEAMVFNGWKENSELVTNAIQQRKTQMQTPQSLGIVGTDQQYDGVVGSQTTYGPSDMFKDGPKLPKVAKRRLLFLRAFDESLVQVVRYERNMHNPRFGQPVMYRVTLNDPREQHSGIGLPLATVFVHWSRVQHLNDVGCVAGASEIFSPPRMRSPLNDILNGRKVRGSGAEGYYKSCFTAYSFETNPQLGGDVLINKTDLLNQWENFQNGLQRAMMLSGLSMKSQAPTVVDPTPHVDKAIEAICIVLGCPVRVFKGSERGELASSQDDSSWNDRMKARQNYYITPRIIVPFIDRLITLGVLPEPKGYSVRWPDLDSNTDKDKATILLTRTQAYAAYVQGGIEAMIPKKDYMTKFDDMDEEEAEAVIIDAEAAEEQQMLEDQQMAQEQGFEPAPPEGFQAPEPEPPATPIKVKPGEKLVHPASVKAPGG